MAELKFRQLITNKDTGAIEFHYWGYLHTCSVGLPVFINPLGAVEWDLRTSEQYIGVNDCERTDEFPEGQPVYVGDIIKHMDKFYEIKQEDMCFYCDGNEWIDEVKLVRRSNKVGNIHQNGDLLND